MNFPPLTEPPIKGMETIPYGGEMLLPAWVACVKATASDTKAVAAFAKDTGIRVPTTSKSPLDRMIDEATGRDAKIGAAFADWVTRNVWGEEENPATG